MHLKNLFSAVFSHGFTAGKGEQLSCQEVIMALIQVNYVSKSLFRTVTLNVILPVDKLDAETMSYMSTGKKFKTLYLLHGLIGNYTDWVSGTRIQRWAEEKDLDMVISGVRMAVEGGADLKLLIVGGGFLLFQTKRMMNQNFRLISLRQLIRVKIHLIKILCQ